MKLKDFYEKYPTQRDCIKHLEQIVWNGAAVCPYCNSKYNTTLKNEDRKHCNTCNTSFSVTVNTMFHKTKVDLQKWFYVIEMINTGSNFSVRQLGKEIGVTKDTALKMINKIKQDIITQSDLITKV